MNNENKVSALTVQKPQLEEGVAVENTDDKSTQTKMKAEVRLIDTELAMHLLENHHGNRTLSQSCVNDYARDMLEGRWRECGNPINIGPDGNLLNGQHRLWAIVEANSNNPNKEEPIQFEFVIVTEVSNDVHKVFDIGRRRTGPQILGLQNIDKPTIVRGMADKYLRYVKSLNLEVEGVQPYTSIKGQPWKEIKPWQHGMVTKTEPDEYVLAHEAELAELLPYAHEFHKEFKKGKIWYAGFAYIVKKLSDKPYMFDQFHDAVVSGQMLMEGDPRYALRRHLIRQNKAPQSIWEQQFHVAIAVSAWNKWLDGQPVKLLRFSRNMLPMQVVK